jgi:hypothetical protein
MTSDDVGNVGSDIGYVFFSAEALSKKNAGVSL